MLLERTTPRSKCVFCPVGENIDGHHAGCCHRFVDPVSRAMRASELRLCGRCLRPAKTAPSSVLTAVESITQYYALYVQEHRRSVLTPEWPLRRFCFASLVPSIVSLVVHLPTSRYGCYSTSAATAYTPRPSSSTYSSSRPSLSQPLHFVTPRTPVSTDRTGLRRHLDPVATASSSADTRSSVRAPIVLFTPPDCAYSTPADYVSHATSPTPTISSFNTSAEDRP